MHIFRTGIISATLFAAIAAAAGAQEAKFNCDTDPLLEIGKRRILDENPGAYDKVYERVSDGGTLREKRYCAEEIDIPQISELYVFGERRGTFRHSNYWSGRDLELYDSQGRVRVIKSNVTIDFERVMLFNADGTIATSPERFDTSQATFSATSVILKKYSTGSIDDGIVLLWLLHYHGDHNGEDNGIVLARWVLNNLEASRKLFAKLDKDTSVALAQKLGYGIAEQRSNEAAIKAFRMAFKRGDSNVATAVIKLLDTFE